MLKKIIIPLVMILTALIISFLFPKIFSFDRNTIISLGIGIICYLVGNLFLKNK
ncbi:putative protein without homology [Lactobacillus crispatus ST1]|uniref:Group-specific protein n=1 Tax=Lactobacillus crispatus (strain ST1) TaxID=748671 RepID=D5H0N2_LACCS|nr:putative protein without homology [Lactobacillus crispatus ST1]